VEDGVGVHLLNAGLHLGKGLLASYYPMSRASFASSLPGEVCCDRLHKGLDVTHSLLGRALTDTDSMVIGFMPESQEVRQGPTQMGGVAFPSLDELPDKAGLGPIMSPATG